MSCCYTKSYIQVEYVFCAQLSTIPLRCVGEGPEAYEVWLLNNGTG